MKEKYLKLNLITFIDNENYECTKNDLKLK